MVRCKDDASCPCVRHLGVQDASRSYVSLLKKIDNGYCVGRYCAVVYGSVKFVVAQNKGLKHYCFLVDIAK